MPDWAQIISDALDILKFDGAVQDTLAELREKWGAQVPALLDERFDAVGVQYMKLSHEKGAAALGQELSAFGWALYNLDDEDEYLFALIPEEERSEWERYCKKQGQYCHLMKQQGRKWGDHAKKQDPGKLMPCEEYILQDEYDYFFNSLAGDFAAGEWKNQNAEEWKNGCVADLRHRPPQVIRSHSLPHLGCLTYSPEHELYAASRAAGSGTIGRALLSKNPVTLNWAEPSPIGYDGPPQTLCWADHSLWVGDPTNATRIELTDRGTCQDVKNWTLPEDGWSTKYHCGITTDGLGRVYFSNEWYQGQIYCWENGKVTKHTFSLDGYDHLSEAVPIPGTGRITMIHAVSGKGRVEECLLELDMDTGRCRIATLPGMGEGLELRWFTGDWLLVQGNGEILSDDFAQLINMNTREVLRIRPGMFGGEKMQHIGILTDGTVVIVTRRDRVGPVFRYPIDFWGFLRTANKPKKLEWREYKEVYPNLPFFLPSKATERKIIIKKDSLTILGSVFTPPFTLSQLTEKLGSARIVLQNGTRKSPITGRESPYTQALALWDELGLQGWLDEDEQTIKTFGVRVAAQGEYAVRQTFDGAVWIGSKDYREASWKDFAGLAHTLKLGGFTVYTRLPGPVPEEQSAQKAKLEALSAMVQISWKEPENKAAKVQKYQLSKPTEPVLTFTSFNFKLAVMEVLMYEKGLLAPKLDAHEFAREYSRRKIDIDAEGYEPIPEIRKWLEKYPVTILGSVFTPPFTLSQLTEKLGSARIVLQNGTRKSPITGRESPYTQALALWDELGLQGWLDEDEQTIKTFGVRVAAQGEYAVRQTFDGAVWIGSKDYREASWKDFAGLAHTLKLGGFTVYTRLPGPVPEEQSAQKAKLEALSAMVQISWKEPENKAAKVQKYQLSKPTEPVLTFTSFNFKLAVMEVLMYEKGLLAPKLDAHEFAREYSRRKIDIDAEGYEPIPEIRKWLEKYPVPERLAPEVTEIEMDGGSEIYTQLCPFWDGEDGAFDLNTITEAELRQFPNLKHITLMSSKPEQVLPVLEQCSIKVDLL